MSRHTLRSAHHEIDPEDVDDAPAEPARALVDGVAIEMPARVALVYPAVLSRSAKSTVSFSPVRR